MRRLPNPMRDLLRDGIRGADLDRSRVAVETRRVMLSAYRRGYTYEEVARALTDRRNRLAVQIGTGKGGRPIGSAKRHEFLAKHWREVHALAKQRPAWNRHDAVAFVERVRDEVERSDLPDRERAVMLAALDLADEYGTTRVAIPVRIVEERTGLARNTVHRILMRLSDDGEWLALARRGQSSTRRANLYNLAPPLALEFQAPSLEPIGGATPPESQPPPKSHPPKSHEESGMDGIRLTREQIVTVLGEAAYANLMANVAVSEHGGAEVRHLRAVGDDEEMAR